MLFDETLELACASTPELRLPVDTKCKWLQNAALKLRQSNSTTHKKVAVSKSLRSLPGHCKILCSVKPSQPADFRGAARHSPVLKEDASISSVSNSWTSSSASPGSHELTRPRCECRQTDPWANGTETLIQDQGHGDTAVVSPALTHSFSLYLIPGIPVEPKAAGWKCSQLGLLCSTLSWICLWLLFISSLKRWLTQAEL